MLKKSMEQTALIYIEKENNKRFCENLTNFVFHKWHKPSWLTKQLPVM
jgi:hypothetical protein